MKKWQEWEEIEYCWRTRQRGGLEDEPGCGVKCQANDLSGENNNNPGENNGNRKRTHVRETGIELCLELKPKKKSRILSQKTIHSAPPLLLVGNSIFCNPSLATSSLSEVVDFRVTTVVEFSVPDHKGCSSKREGRAAERVVWGEKRGRRKGHSSRTWLAAWGMGGWASAGKTVDLFRWLLLLTFWVDLSHDTMPLTFAVDNRWVWHLNRGENGWLT